MSPAGECDAAPEEPETLANAEVLMASKTDAGCDELTTLRKDLAKLTQEVAELRLQSHGQVSALAHEVQSLKAHLGGIGSAIREELSTLSSSPPPAPTPQAQCWAAAAAAAWQASMAQHVQQMMQSAAAAVPVTTAGQPEAATKEPEVCASSAPPPSWQQQQQSSQTAPENKSGRELMTLLQKGSKGSKQAGQQQSEPVKMSLDEFCLWQMQSREDAEGGADVRNAETFGEDAEANWSFEENLAANLRLAEGRQQGHCGASAWQPLKTHLDGVKAPTSTDSTGAEDEQASTASSVRSEPSGAGPSVESSTRASIELPRSLGAYASQHAKGGVAGTAARRRHKASNPEPVAAGYACPGAMAGQQQFQ